MTGVCSWIGVVPTLLVFPEDTAWTSEEEHSSLLHQHSVPTEWDLTIPGAGLPMLQRESRNRMNSALMQFINEVM